MVNKMNYRYDADGLLYATHGMSNDSPIFVVICISFSFKIGGTGSRIPAKNNKEKRKTESEIGFSYLFSCSINDKFDGHY